MAFVVFITGALLGCGFLVYVLAHWMREKPQLSRASRYPSSVDAGNESQLSRPHAIAREAGHRGERNVYAL
jgi:hypothetical protein